MNLDLFRQNTAGRVVQIGSGQTAYYAFIPNQLPPELEVNARLLRELSDADRALGELAGLGRTMANPNPLIRPFMSREAVLSSKIEGTQADFMDLFAYTAETPHSTSASKYADVREVYNYVRAMEYGLKRVVDFPVSLRLIRELHEQLMKGVRGGYATPGEFRKSQNWIGPPGCTLNDATFVPPPVDEMQTALDLFEKYLHARNSYPPLVRLALIHYQFETIHPFLDGNGRIGRLLLILLLVYWELLPLPLLYLSAFFERNRNRYYELLLSVSQTGNWSEWLSFFLQGVYEQSRDAVQRAKQLQDLQQEWRHRLQRARASAIHLGAVDHLFVQPIVTAARIRNRFKVTHPTALSTLRRLAREGIVVEQSKTPTGNRWFVAEQILSIVEK